MEAIDHFNDGHNPPSKAKGQFDACRVKGLPDRDLDKLLNLLTNPTVRAAHKMRQGTYDAILAAFLRANVLTGLRPSEWDTAKWTTLDKVTVLWVGNRKTTNGRGNGVARLISVHPDAVPAIQAMMDERDRLYALGAAWPEIQSGMASRLKEVRHLVTRKTYTLYSTRHRFVSAAKQSGYSKGAIADMLGHASEETATLHYGRRSATTGGGKAASEQVTEKPLMGVAQGVGVASENVTGNEPGSTPQLHVERTRPTPHS
jgi:integrase